MTPVTSYRNQGRDTSTTSYTRALKRSPIDRSGTISSHSARKLSESSLLKERVQVHSDTLKKASILARQFRSIFTVNEEVLDNIHFNVASLPPIPDVTISEQSVTKLLKGVDPRKATGPDQALCRMLQELHEELTPVFITLFRNP